MFRIAFAAFLSAAPLMAQHLVTDEPLCSPCPAPEGEKVLIRCAKGLVLVSDPKDLLRGKELDQFEGFRAICLDVPGSSERFAVALESLYLGKDLTRSSIDEIKAAVAEYYRGKNFPLVRVEVPKQDVTSGVLQLVVLESRLGCLSVEGGRWQWRDYLQKRVEMPLGEPIDESRLSQNLSFLNKNPFRRVDAIFAPGTEKGTTDLILAVEDRRPFRFYSGVDNTGVDPTGRNRFFAGFNGTWVYWQTDHIFSYQYSADLDFHKFQAHTADYMLLLPWKHSLRAYGGVTFVHPNLFLPGLENKGFSAQVSGRYSIPLTQWRSLVQDVSIGYDFKRTDNTFNVAELNFRGGTLVNLSQFMLGYSGSYQTQTAKLSFVGELFYSPGKMVADQADKNFNKLQPGAVNDYFYGRAMLGYLQRLPYSCSLSLVLRGQLSNKILLPSEELGIGGYDTVRGYEERQINKDDAMIANLELRSPPLSIARAISKNTKVKDAIEFLAFFDAGFGSYADPIPFQPDMEYLMGAGPGVRYTLDPYLACRLDWGFKLHHKDLYGGGFSMLHFSVVGSY